MLIVATVGGSSRLGHSQNISGQSAEHIYKNIQVLKDIKPEQLPLAMQFMSDSLGVECNFCHVPGAFEKDDKKTKQTARKMMRMMFAINQQNFEGRSEVTCYSCHRGTHHPLVVPPIAGKPGESQAANGGSPAPVGALPLAEQILQRYLQAVGGESALESVSNRIEEGTAEIEGRDFPLQIYYEGPDKLSSVIHLPAGDSRSIYDGRSGWIAFPGQPVRNMEPYQLDGAREDADLCQPLALAKSLTGLQVEGAEKIGEQETYVAAAVQNEGPPVRLYFDQDSGLLVRLVRYIESPLGRNPVQTDFFDYRQSGPVKIPFRWTVARPRGRFTIQLDRVRQNVLLDQNRFARPVEQRALNKP